MLRKAARIGVIFAVIGAYFNSADLLVHFQPEERWWVAYLAAASVGIGLFLCIESLLHLSAKKLPIHWSLYIGLVFFTLAELSGQVLHAALTLEDVTVMTPLMTWLMGYLSPSLVVLAGIALPLVAQHGFPRPADDSTVDPIAPVRSDLASIVAAVESVASDIQDIKNAPAPVLPAPVGSEIEVARLLRAVEAVRLQGKDPNEYLIDTQNYVLTKAANGHTKKAVIE